MQTKVCTKCGQEKPATEEFFYKHDEGKYGLRPDCCLCHGARSKKYREVNAERLRAWRVQYNAENGERIRLGHRESYRRHRAARLQSAKEYHRKNYAAYLEKLRKWRRLNKDKVNVWLRNRRARIRGNGGEHSIEDIRQLLADQNGECSYCGTGISLAYQVDHITPVSRGGVNDPTNLQLLCKKCNLSKRDMMPLEYFIKLAAIEKGEIRG